MTGSWMSYGPTKLKYFASRNTRRLDCTAFCDLNEKKQARLLLNLSGGTALYRLDAVHMLPSTFQDQKLLNHGQRKVSSLFYE